MEIYANVLLWVIPIFFVLIVLEIIYGYIKKNQTHTFMDTLSSLSSGMTNILKDVFNQAKIVTVDKIQNTVSNYFNISLNDMLSQRRSRPLARPRQIAMFLAKRLTTRSLPEIGRRFANRDHTTVIHAVKTITRLSEKDEEMKKNLAQIKGLLLEN